ncbi:MAG TPA: hypothetical protein VFX98_13225 [Longimicrobiaceae bacterium]|nr:hypothetical protein [Longimicrobiaceae bacterium]
MSQKFELEALSNDMFAPLSEKEASLVVGGQAARPIGYSYYDTVILWSDGTWSPDELVVDHIYLVAVPVAAE